MLSRRRRTTPAADVLNRLRREAPPQIHELPPPVDPWMWTAHTMQVPVIVYVERNEQ